MARYIILSIVIIGIVSGATRVYDIEPYRNCNGWSPQGPPTTAYIGQTFVAICDSFVWVDMFIGQKCIHPDGNYHVEIWEYPTGDRIAYGETAAIADYSYAHIPLTMQTGVKIIKGKQYILKITHSDGDSINFYYNPQDTYKFGVMEIAGSPQTNCDLAARIEGINKNSC
jgi:hypothetical protein